MLVEIARQLGTIDETLSLQINVVDNMYTLSVENSEVGTIYSYSSTSLCEGYERIIKFLECLKDPDKFEDFTNEILETALEV